MKPRGLARSVAPEVTMPARTATMTWYVFKFGGTCLADAGRIERAAELVARQAGEGRCAVVVSAMGGTTDALLQACQVAAEGGPYGAGLRAVRERASVVCRELLGAGAESLVERISVDLGAIDDVCRGVQVAGVCPLSTSEFVAGFGELWSAAILQAVLIRRAGEAALLDARDVLVVERGETGATVLAAETGERFERWRRAHTEQIVVITGYVARDASGQPTTLGRNGSDYTASIFAGLFDARAITIWTDVDGVMSADPRRVPEARLVSMLTYDEAMELAYFGAQVLHPQTMGPAVGRGIPIHIKNALHPEAPGTIICATPPGMEREARAERTDRSAVKGFSLVERVALLNLEGTGLIGVPGVASRMFAALREASVSVTMISQASSEHSICTAIPAAQEEVARAAVEEAFSSELRRGQVQSVEVSGPYVVLAAVGDEMVETPGVAARFFGALARAGINVRAIAQGSSERNISVIVAAADAERALRSVHAGFYLSDQAISIGLIGPGGVGAELLAQLAERPQLDLSVRGIADSRRMLLDDRGIDLSCWRARLASSGVPLDLRVFAEHVAASHLPAAAIVDCTASERVADCYAGWLARGLHVVTPNKKAGTHPLAAYLRLRDLGNRVSSQFLYEATVGAGLPIISTLRELIRTGDRIERIEGVLSGSLSFVLQALDGGESFSAAVRAAWDRGYMEPDPRDDLSGMDVARKAVILGREMGLPISLADVPVESLIPPALRDCAEPARFLERLVEHDGLLAARGAGPDHVLRHVAVIEGSGRAAVELRSYPLAHPFARIGPGDNIIAFTTQRYAEQPLIVQGPGAGRAVTAAGVFGDLLRLVGPAAPAEPRP